MSLIHVPLFAALALGQGPPPAGTLTPTATFKHGGGVNAVFFGPDDESLFTAGRDGRPKIINGQSHNGRVKMWSLSKGKEEPAPPPFRHGVHSAAITPDGRYLAASTGGILQGPRGRPNVVEPGELLLFDTTGKKPTAALKSEAFDHRCLAFSPDGKTLAAGTSPQNRRGIPMNPGGLVALWDVANAKALTPLKGHTGYVWSVAFSPDGKLLASASGVPDRKAGGKGELKLWDVTTGKEKAALAGHEGQVQAVAFSPDGKLLASGGEDGTVRLWDVAKGQQVASLKGHAAPVVAAVFSPDSKLLATGGGDLSRDRSPGELKLWDVAARAEKVGLSGHERVVHSVAFDHSGARLASGGRDGDVKVWAVGAAKPKE
jgi:WD40 repeat protein